MRIRKRQVPLPFASISPVPLSSDPNFNRSPTVQLPLLHQHPPLPTPCFDPHYPSDHPNRPIGQRFPTQGHDSSALPGTTTTIHGDELNKKKKEDYLILKQGEGKEEESGEGKKGNDNREKSVIAEELGSGSVSRRSSSHQAVGSWGEGEKVFPLKKRRGSFERRGNDDDDDNGTIMERDNKRKVMINTNKIMKTKMNKKSVQQQQQQNDNQQEEKESKDYASSTVDCNNDDNNHPSSTKKRGRGGALKEGSRCSRVNGRGWRCCQQTLVGYSLCEHHLGKGRLRSLNSVRSRSLASIKNNAAKEERPHRNDHEHHQTLSNYSSPSQQAKQTKRESLGYNGDDEAQEDQKPLMTTKKLGVVKARSISSLLSQNDNVIAVADDNN